MGWIQRGYKCLNFSPAAENWYDHSCLPTLDDISGTHLILPEIERSKGIKRGKGQVMCLLVYLLILWCTHIQLSYSCRFFFIGYKCSLAVIPHVRGYKHIFFDGPLEGALLSFMTWIMHILANVLPPAS